MMKVSVVTACFNMETLIRQTLQSVQGQSMRAEYIVVDGASGDGTLKVINRFQDSIDLLISEQDTGQYEAINKGFSKANGDIFCWLNADDILMPWTISVVTEIFKKHPDIMWITGLPSFLNFSGQLVQVQKNIGSYPQNFIANGWYSRDFGGYLQQESMFWRRELWEQAGGLDTRYRLAADFDLWTRFAKIAPLVPVDIPLAAFRERPDQRSARFADQYEAEVEKCCENLPKPALAWRVLTQKSVIMRSLCRLLIRRKSVALIFSRAAQKWVKVRGWRSVSRLSLQQLASEFQMRRQK